MDPAPRDFDDLPLDPDLGLPVPFACGTPVPGSPRTPTARELQRSRVIQCALSRVCGVCGASLGRPLTLLGSQEEVDRNAFHFPPSHLECATRLIDAYAGVSEPVLGRAGGDHEWHLVTTGGFEFVRPTREDLDQRPRFEPNSVLAVDPG
ncbi:hypothetical protein [Nocardioides marmoribigeumensis]|uniref:Uncharacterized protein n=1 Tax=Nocardioides marmoribigeumensis TaxID=433649 RepID=A0ABU2BUQ4_9ACTN|nr:hypothetical protein [Nocardioides marmoribigeumensis]MDR7362367.1 hypothetical protein [Nocardioides marmoribigeumensis]